MSDTPESGRRCSEDTGVTGRRDGQPESKPGQAGHSGASATGMGAVSPRTLEFYGVFWRMKDNPEWCGMTGHVLRTTEELAATIEQLSRNAPTEYFAAKIVVPGIEATP